MKTRGALLWEPGTRSGWSVEEIEIDPPKQDEALVELAASGICHSDDHLDTGDFPLPWAPVLGGHEGAGIVREVGPGVTAFAPGDHVVMAFMPSCGHCRFCLDGQRHLCDIGAGALAGKAPDGTNRVHARGHDVGGLSYLGTFSPWCCAPVPALIKIDERMPLTTAALLGCCVPTGWGSSVNAADVRAGDVVVVIGVGGVGMNAVQGARMRGAAAVVAVDPVAFKRDSAPTFGATHVARDVDEATAIVAPMTNGQGADRVVFTAGVAHGDLIQPAAALTRKGGTLVVTSVSPALQSSIDFDMLTFTLSHKRLQGCLYGGVNAVLDVPTLVDAYLRGALLLDELITRTYALDEVNQAFDDMRTGKNLRGVITY